MGETDPISESDSSLEGKRKNGAWQTLPLAAEKHPGIVFIMWNDCYELTQVKLHCNLLCNFEVTNICKHLVCARQS